MKTIHEVFNAVERGLCDYGLTPIENSTGGTVGETLDCFVDSDLLISGEVLLRVSYNFFSKAGKLGSIKRIYSHPQAIAQTWSWVRSHLPDAEIVEVTSTAEAARRAKNDAQSAAITGKLAGQTYGLKAIAECIEDYHQNFTRFLVIGRDITHPTGRDRTSLLLSLKDEPGILFKALEPLAQKSLNLSKIESRPLKQKAWEYLFFIDVDGHQEDTTIKDTIEEVRSFCLFLKVLGSYPRD
jgi:chorismate mutase/prephenate dehydratase